jgi:hypothetical protein
MEAKRSKQIVIKVTPAEFTKFRKLAHINFTTLSALVRQLLHSFNGAKP